MKIRSDFVSNSSSSSFVFSTKLNPISLSNHINDVLKKNGHLNLEDQFHNEMVIRYCCTFYKLLFLGSIEYKTSDDIYLYSDIIGNFNLDDVLQKNWFKQSTDEEWIDDICKSIYEHGESRNGFYLSQDDINIAKITKETIEITEKLIKLGKDIHIDQSKINSVKKALENGDDVYTATFRDNGEGKDSGSIFVPRSTNINIEYIKPEKFEEIFELPVLINLEEDYQP